VSYLPHPLPTGTSIDTDCGGCYPVGGTVKPQTPPTADSLREPGAPPPSRTWAGKRIVASYQVPEPGQPPWPALSQLRDWEPEEVRCTVYFVEDFDHETTL
jgi:hypothetical protein